MRWDKGVGSRPDPGNNPTMLLKRLVKVGGRRIDLHRMVQQDLPERYHTHPGEAIRIILWGWYVEELEGGRHRLWLPGMFGLVRRSCSHRIHAASRRCFTLWVRGREHVPVELRGKGWENGS